MSNQIVTKNKAPPHGARVGSDPNGRAGTARSGRWCAKRAGARGAHAKRAHRPRGDAHGTHDVGGGLTTRRGVTRPHGGGTRGGARRLRIVTT